MVTRKQKQAFRSVVTAEGIAHIRKVNICMVVRNKNMEMFTGLMLLFRSLKKKNNY